MNCPRCTNPVEEGSKFCTHCGEKVGGLEQAATFETEVPSAPRTSGSDTPYVPQPQQPEQRTNLQDNPYVKQGKEISKMYFSFALQALKNPFKLSQTAGERDVTNGIISLVLIALLLPLYSFIGAKKVTRGYIETSFFDVVIIPLFILLIFLLAVTATLFLAAKMMKVNISFKSVMAKFGTISTIPAALFLLATVSMIIGIYVLSGLLVFIGTLAMFLSVTATVFSLKSNQPAGGVDAFYAVFITYFIIIILFLILGESIFTAMVDNIEDQIESFFW